MAAVVLRRDVALEVPRLLIGAVQPYQTLGGPALTTSFLHQPDLLPFQRAPFTHPAVAPLYFHTLLHTLAEFAETPRAVQHSAVKLRHAPKDDFWDAVGTLNCFYFSSHRPYEPRAAAAATASVGSSKGDTHHHHHHHPAMGAVELVRPSHRKECDVKLTLFDGAHQPVASMLMTGPKTVAQVSSAEAGAALGDAVARTPLPALPPPTSSSSWRTGPTTGEAGNGGVAAVLLGGTRVCGGLYGDLVPMQGSGSGGFAHRAYYRLVDAAASTPAPASQSHDSTAAAAGAGTEGAGTAMPPWLLHEVVGQFFTVLHRAGVYGDAEPGVPALMPPPPSPSTSSSSSSSSLADDAWQLVSHHVVQVDDPVFGVPFEVVCAPPRVYPRYHLPPWRLRLGLPHLTGGPVPCVCLRCEVRQGGRLMSTGVYFFCCRP